MTEIVSLADTVKDIGIPALFFLVVIYIMFKVVPKVIKSKQEADAKQQEYYTQRQKQYDEQMGEIIKVAEQGTQAVRMANTIIENNTKAVEQNTAMHNKVIEALTRDFEETQKIQTQLISHDARAENIQYNLRQLLGRSDVS